MEVDLEGNGRCLIHVQSRNFPQLLRKVTKKRLRIIGTAVWIPTEHLLNTSFERYREGSLLYPLLK
jgi:hypothetical protein